MAQVLEQCQPVEASWRSFNRITPLWQKSDVDLVAAGILGLMPAMAIEVIKTGSFSSPEVLVKLQDPLKGAKRGDLIRNYLFLEPLQKAYPKAVPSSFFIADCIWSLNSMLGFKLLGPLTDTTRKSTLKAAMALKSCLGFVRVLKRQGATSRVQHINNLKQLCCYEPGRALPAHRPTSTSTPTSNLTSTSTPTSILTSTFTLAPPLASSPSTDQVQAPAVKKKQKKQRKRATIREPAAPATPATPATPSAPQTPSRPPRRTASAASLETVTKTKKTRTAGLMWSGDGLRTILGWHVCVGLICPCNNN